MAEDVHSLGDAHAEREMFFANSCFFNTRWTIDIHEGSEKHSVNKRTD